PVPPVRTERPGAKSMSSRSIRTMSRMERRDSITEADLLEGLADPGALILGRLEPARPHQGIGVLVPRAVGEIVPEHGCRGLRLADDAERHVELGEPHQRFLDVTRRLIPGDDHLEAVDGGRVVLAVLIPAADVHLLAGELVAGDLELLARLGG